MAKIKVVIIRRKDGSLLIDLDASNRDCDKGHKILETLLEVGGLRNAGEETLDERGGGIPIPEKLREG